MATCANCTNTALYTYQVTEDFGIDYCQYHLPTFLSKLKYTGALKPKAVEPVVEVKATKKKAAAPVVETPVVEEAPIVEAAPAEEAPVGE
jgi:hypothetical protein